MTSTNKERYQNQQTDLHGYSRTSLLERITYKTVVLLEFRDYINTFILILESYM